MKKRFFALLLSTLLTLALFSARADSGYTVSVDDEAGLLGSLEIELLAQDMAKLTAYGDAAFWSTNAPGTVDVLAEQYFDQHISPQRSHSGVVMVIDMNSREICIFTRGDLEKKVGRAGAYAITDNIYRYASFGQYYRCAQEGFNQVYALAEGQRIFSPMRMICNLLMAVSAALIAAFLIVRHTSVQALRAPDKQEMKTQVDLQILDQRLIKSTRHRRESAVVVTGGGGGHGGGGFSGGGHSGGGGFSGGGHSGGGSSGSHGF
ncbi:MAG: TPM domain-containing protein [Clostridia bacterium]|nr:TPM domain-containing protein [Clostridia bacterium]